MPRSISVTRRKPDLIDLFVDRRPDVIAYEFSVADNFDTTPVVFQEIPIYGYASPSVRGDATTNKYAGAIGQPYRRNKTRFVFAPSDYSSPAQTTEGTVDLADANFPTLGVQTFSVDVNGGGPTVVTLASETNFAALKANIEGTLSGVTATRADGLSGGLVLTTTLSDSSASLVVAEGTGAAALLGLAIETVTGSGFQEMRDDKPIFLTIRQKNKDGTYGVQEALHMVMESNWTALHAIQLQGTAPAGADLTASLEIQLPMQCTGWTIQNDGSNALYVAFDRGAVIGAEYLIPAPGANWNNNLDKYSTPVSQIFIRGDTDISAVFTARNEKT